MPTAWYSNGTNDYLVTANTGYTTNQVWTVWVDSGTSTTISNQVWQGWQNLTQTTLTIGTTPVYGGYQPPQRTPEQIAADEARYAEQRRVWEAQEAERQAEREAASQRARVLLEENLSAEQRAQLRDNNWFEVVTPKGHYRIRHGRSGNVDRLVDGRAVERFCIHPTEGVPNEDTMLAQKLLLETDEDAFRRIANISRV